MTDRVTDDDLVTAWGLAVEAMARAGRVLGAELESGAGIGATSAEVLFRLRRTPGERLPATRLAAEISFTSGGFTKLADRLVAAGLLERQPCPTDRRVVYLHLSDEGRAVADRALEVHAAGLRRHLLGPLGAEGVGELAAAMRRLRDTAVDGSAA